MQFNMYIPRRGVEVNNIYGIKVQYHAHGRSNFAPVRLIFIGISEARHSREIPMETTRHIGSEYYISQVV